MSSGGRCEANRRWDPNQIGPEKINLQAGEDKTREGAEKTPEPSCGPRAEQFELGDAPIYD